MQNLLSLRLAAWLFVLIACPAFALQNRDIGPLPNNTDKLVTRMAGAHLPSEAVRITRPDSPGWHAAEAQWKMKDDAVSTLAKGLESDDRTIRLNVAFVPGRIGTPATLPLRIKSASDSDPEVRALAVAGLPAYRGDEERQVLLKTLNDPDPVVRNAAIWAFQPRNEAPNNLIRDSTARMLIPLLDDPATRFAAADVLGGLGMNSAARPLLELLNVEDKKVRSVAVVALGRLKDSDHLSGTEPHGTIRRASGCGCRYPGVTA